MRLAALFVGVLMASCQNATQPSPPPAAPPTSPAGPDVLVIIPGLSGIKLGVSATLTAVVISGSVPPRSVAATWASDAPDVVTIQPDGHIYGARFGETTIRATHETLAASLPLRVVPDYAGNWSGRYRVTDCIRISGPAPSPCRFIVGCCFGLRIALTQNGATLSGSLDFLDNTNTLVVETGRVSGEIDVTNVLVVTGTTRNSDSGEQPSQSTLKDWSTTLTGDNGQMVGGFIRLQNYRNFFGDQQLKLTCELEGVQRSNR